MSEQMQKSKDKPWLMRTYAGHSNAAKSNALYRQNLAKGQTGLSIAFDLPTQTGYDSDHPLALGEVGKVGVPISHLGDMEALLEGIPLDRMNTSMTINAPAAWLLSLYIAAAERKGVPRAKLQGTTQNDIVKEYLSRGTYIFPPAASLKLTADVIAFAVKEVPQWNPTNVCSYHLQEAGATPVQELAFALATAIAVLDAVKASGQVSPQDFPQVVGRISFFVNAGLKLVTEISKLRAFQRLWEELCRDRYGVNDEKLTRFRYGVQVNSLGLTEQQPENNVYRILLEMLAVVLSKNARARAVQLPAWNEALGLPRPFDQQWSLRLQQIVAFETDILEYGDIFDGSPVIEAKVDELCRLARAELQKIEGLGGALAAVEGAYMKSQLVESATRRQQAIESGEQIVVGVNAFKESEPSPLSTGEGSFMTVDDSAEMEQIGRLKTWRQARDKTAATRALQRLKDDAAEGKNIMEASIQAAHAGVTTGEWGKALRQVFGEYRAPTGIEGHLLVASGEKIEDVRQRVAALSQRLGHSPRFLVGKPGLDGHSNGAEQVAVRAKDCGFDVIYEGIRLTPAEIVERAKKDGAEVIGLSILSGSHVRLVQDVMGRLRAAGLEKVPVVVGGIIPDADASVLRQCGVAQIYTPKDFDLTGMMGAITTLIEERV